MNSCLIPTPKADLDGDSRWHSMHNRNKLEAKSTECEILWIGDSIFQQLQFSTLWKTKISSLHCINFGIGGDRVEHILWRVENGELDFNSKIKAIILQVGTNNTNSSAMDIYEGIVNLVNKIKNKLKNASIILLTLLPRGQFPNKRRDKNFEVNKLLIQNYQKNNDKNIFLVPIHEEIIQEDGTISHHLLYDYLHLTDYAYTKIFGPVYEKLLEIIKEKNS